MWPFAQVCQRARVKATAASVAIRAATAGRFVRDASERGGGTLARPGVPSASASAAPVGPPGCSGGKVKRQTRDGGLS